MTGPNFNQQTDRYMLYVVQCSFKFECLDVVYVSPFTALTLK